MFPPTAVLDWSIVSPLPLHWLPGSSFPPRPPVWQSCRAEEARRDLEPQNGDKFMMRTKHNTWATGGRCCSIYLLPSLQASTWNSRRYIQSDRSLRKTVEHRARLVTVIDKRDDQVGAAHLTAQCSSQERQDGRRHRSRSCNHESDAPAQTRLTGVRQTEMI